MIFAAFGADEPSLASRFRHTESSKLRAVLAFFAVVRKVTMLSMEEKVFKGDVSC